MMHRIFRTALCGWLMALSLPGLAAGQEAPPAASASVDLARQTLLEALNGFRRDAGAPALSLDAALSTAATGHAQEVARRGNLELPAGSDERMQERLATAGYAARRWTESLVATSAPLDAWIDDWLHCPVEETAAYLRPYADEKLVRQNLPR